MKLKRIIEMQLDYMVLNKFRRAVKKSDKKIEKLKEELQVEGAYNKLISKKALKLCRELNSKYENELKEV